jgi:hypothetical protein
MRLRTLLASTLAPLLAVQACSTTLPAVNTRLAQALSDPRSALAAPCTREIGLRGGIR